MNKFRDKAIDDFIAELSGKEPVPGGGGAAALVGALGTALGLMVGNLTVGKEKYKEFEEAITEAMAMSETLVSKFLELIDSDAEAFAPLAEAYRLPADTEEEKQIKSEAMEPALKEAVLVPADIMRKCAAAIELLDVFAEYGSVMALSDAACGAVLAKAAMKAAWLNVCVNTKLMKDRKLAESINMECGELLADYSDKADSIYDSVEAGLIC